MLVLSAARLRVTTKASSLMLLGIRCTLVMAAYFTGGVCGTDGFGGAVTVADLDAVFFTLPGLIVVVPFVIVLLCSLGTVAVDVDELSGLDVVVAFVAAAFAFIIVVVLLGTVTLPVAVAVAVAVALGCAGSCGGSVVAVFVAVAAVVAWVGSTGGCG
jgi:uncharacterized membrane protein